MTEHHVGATMRKLIDRARRLSTQIEHDPGDPAHCAAAEALDARWQALGPARAGMPVPADLERARCAHAVGDVQLALGNHAAAQRLLGEAIDTFVLLIDPDDLDSGLQLSQARCSLAASLNLSGRAACGLEVAQSALAWHRGHRAGDNNPHERSLSMALHLVGMACGHLGRSQEAVDATGQAIAIRRRLVDGGAVHVRPELARSHGNLALWLSDLGLYEQALEQTEKALSLYREIGQSNPGAARPGIARESNNLGTMLSGLGRHEEALQATREALELRREDAQRNPGARRSELASSLHNVGAMLHELERYGEALLETREAVRLRRELAAEDRLAHMFLLASSLLNEGTTLERLGRHEEALKSNAESIVLFRELHELDPLAVMEPLAMACCEGAKTLLSLGRAAQSEQMARGAVERYRALALETPLAFDLRLATSLNQHAEALRALDRRDLASAEWREAADMLLRMGLEDPHAWCRQMRQAIEGLDRPGDLDTFYLPMLQALMERRELAHDTRHARLYLSLQQDVVAAAWRVLERVSDAEPGVVAHAAPTIVGMLHSPDLASWIASRLEQAPEYRVLHAARREVMVADKSYLGWLGRRQAGDDVGAKLADAGTHAARARARYRRLREDLISSTNAQASFSPPSAADLRDTLGALTRLSERQSPANARHAMLCLLVLDAGASQRVVGLLVPDRELPLTVLEFAGLGETARVFERYQVASRDDRRALRRPVADNSASDGGSSTLSELQGALENLDNLLVQPVAGSLSTLTGASRGWITLHLCTQGVLQHLPLAAVRDSWARMEVDIIQWPGLPYARAAAQRVAAAPQHQGWLIAHDCAWSKAPLPMAAVEAALLASLVKPLVANGAGPAGELSGRPRAIVVCGHGESATHLEGSFSIGGHSVTLERIVDEQLGPDFALLPLCHGGETTEDPSGNAFGVAAAFLLGGARVVVASSKAVDDQLIPWFTTLLVWHMVRPGTSGLGAREAAHLARQQLARGKFPPAFRRWLIEALPAAMATIQPGGPEWLVLSANRSNTYSASDELKRAFASWAWHTEVEPADMFSANAVTREEAVRSVAQTVLVTPGSDAHELQHRLMELATFMFVYGSG